MNRHCVAADGCCRRIAMAAASDFGLSQNPTGKRRPACCPKIIDAEHVPLAGSFRFALAGGSVSCQKFTTMSQILDYYRKRLGTAFDDEKYHFEVNGGTPVSFKELTQIGRADVCSSDLPKIYDDEPNSRLLPEKIGDCI